MSKGGAGFSISFRPFVEMLFLKKTGRLAPFKWSSLPSFIEEFLNLSLGKSKTVPFSQTGVR